MKKTILLIVLSISVSINIAAQKKVTEYQCLPCGRDCDNKVYTKPEGSCSSCMMKLVAKKDVFFKNIAAAEICAYIKKNPGAILLDVRTPEEFTGKADPNFGSLKNAINIPVQVLESSLSTINTYKNKQIIVYCSHSHRSQQAAYILNQNGFTNVTNMLGGMSTLPKGTCLQ
jgi:rhodanese-related sulfurtransferase/DNA-directed RNA polymerase subunit RPC12/RpoP